MPKPSPMLNASALTAARTLGARIARERKRRGITAAALAAEAGMSRVTLHRIERGNPSVTLGAYLAALDALDLQLDVCEPPPDAAPDPPPFTYAEMAEIIAVSEDWRFVVRQLRELVLAVRREDDQTRVDAIHRDPGSTGVVGWDALLGGVASLTGRGRVSDPALLNWCFDADRYCVEWFDPLDSGRFIWLDYLRTPVELRVRNVVLPYGNLEGA